LGLIFNTFLIRKEHRRRGGCPRGFWIHFYYVFNTKRAQEEERMPKRVWDYFLIRLLIRKEHRRRGGCPRGFWINF
jgi:hypothetical protein